MIEIANITMRYGGVTSLDDVSVTFPVGTCGLIGPNGAGKTTMFNVLSGLARPASGSITAFGTDLLKMSAYRRARWGVRRSFQTEQTISGLTVFDNVAIVQEHAGGGARLRREQVEAALDFVGLGDKAGDLASSLNQRERRVLELARAVVGEPRLVLLDEPAAGLTEEETSDLVRTILRIPGERGALVILVDHDMSLVSAVCEVTAVLDFGKLVTSGPTAEVLRNEHVQRAYLGTEDVI
jgi:branched-chain amino acid transport system ATP-binding protein